MTRTLLPLAAALLTPVLWTACDVGRVGPATPGSPSAEEVAAVEAIAKQAQEVERLAFELEQETDRVRRGETPDGTQAGGVEKLQAMTAELEVANTELQADVQALEDRASEAARAELAKLAPAGATPSEDPAEADE